MSKLINFICHNERCANYLSKGIEFVNDSAITIEFFGPDDPQNPEGKWVVGIVDEDADTGVYSQDDEPEEQDLTLS